MDLLYKALSFIAFNGCWLFAVALVAVFVIRDREKRIRFLRVALIFGGIIVGSIFLGAALGKLKPLEGFTWGWASMRLSITYFAIQVESYKILSGPASMVAARILPFGELFLGFWLVLGILRRYAGLIASLVLLGFMCAITYAYLHGLKIDCGCGIGPPEEAGPAALLRDGLRFFLPALLLTIGSFYVRRNRSTAAVPSPVPAVSHAD
jgi:Methylamine utilisation protein MauE